MGVKWFVLFVWFGMWGWNAAISQQVRISGEDSSYSGQSIGFTIQGHPFIDLPCYSETVICDESGAFQLNINEPPDGVIILRTGIYEAALYIESGKSYHVRLPGYQEVSYAEKISPFYEPLRIPLKISDSLENINNQIYSFDSLFYWLNEEIILSRRKGEKPLADSMITWLESQYSEGPTDWFTLHRRYKEGILKLNEGRTGLLDISQNYLGEVVRDQHGWKSNPQAQSVDKICQPQIKNP